MKTIRNNAPRGHVLIVAPDSPDELVVSGGETVVVSDELAMELATQPGLSVEIVGDADDDDLARLKRTELDELAESLGLDPSDYRTKDAVSAAIREAQAAQAQAEEPGDGHDNDHKED